MLFCLFEIMVWLPMVKRRNEWVFDEQVKLIHRCYNENEKLEDCRKAFNEYWTYEQMLSSFHIDDVEKMKGPYKKPWYIIGNRGLLGQPISEEK